MKKKKKGQELTVDDILEHWRLGKSTMDWRSLISPKEKREWLKACLFWTGLPDKKIKALDYIVDGNHVQADLDFYCLMGEAFFGYRGYFGQDAHGLMDCFSEIHVRTQEKEIIERGAKIIFKNPRQISEVMEDIFQEIVEKLRTAGFEIELD